MAEYYLISQLPSLDGLNENSPLPITEEVFAELCNRFLNKKALNFFNSLTLTPNRDFENTGSQFVDRWNAGERDLRLALAKVRAEKLKKTFDGKNREIPANIMQIARVAAETESPLEAEKLLNKYRLEFLEGLRPADSFSEDYIYYYGLKLKLIMRIRQFDRTAGQTAYRNIYNSIMNMEGTVQ